MQPILHLFLNFVRWVYRQTLLLFIFFQEVSCADEPLQQVIHSVVTRLHQAIHPIKIWCSPFTGVKFDLSCETVDFKRKFCKSEGSFHDMNRHGGFFNEAQHINFFLSNNKTVFTQTKIEKISTSCASKSWPSLCAQFLLWFFTWEENSIFLWWRRTIYGRMIFVVCFARLREGNERREKIVWQKRQYSSIAQKKIV